jgi:superfamily II DNA helicase RecQ
VRLDVLRSLFHELRA